jgi:hypothetical protein
MASSMVPASDKIHQVLRQLAEEMQTPMQEVVAIAVERFRRHRRGVRSRQNVPSGRIRRWMGWMQMSPKRGEVWLVTLDTVVGHEQAGTRPLRIILEL